MQRTRKLQDFEQLQSPGWLQSGARAVGTFAAKKSWKSCGKVGTCKKPGAREDLSEYAFEIIIEHLSNMAKSNIPNPPMFPDMGGVKHPGYSWSR